MTETNTHKLRPPRTAHGVERKQQLLDAAHLLFSQQGYAKTRVSDICEAAGVAKGLIHWYFPSKQSLFIEILRDMRSQLDEVLAAATDPDADPLTRLRQRAEAYLRFMAVNQEFFTVVDTGRAEPSLVEEIAAWEASTDVRNAALFAEGQALGLVADGDPHLYARATRILISGFVQCLREAPRRFDADQVVAFALTFLLRSCAAVSNPTIV